MQIPHYALTLDVNATVNRQPVIAKQHDEQSRYIDIVLTAGSTPIVLNKERVTLTAADRKTKETIALTTCNIVDGIIVAELTADILAVATNLDCEITVYGTTGGIITSARFICIVDGKLNTEVVEREADFSALQEALADVASTSDRINEVANRTQPINLGGTGATDKQSAVQNLGAAYLANAVAIPTESDLNDYTNVGTYDVSWATSDYTVSNAPTSQRFKLFVVSTGGVTSQMAVVPAESAIYMRMLSSGVWSSWSKITSMNPTIAEKGSWTPSVKEGTITVSTAKYAYNGQTVTVTASIIVGDDITDKTLTVYGLPLAAAAPAAVTVDVTGDSNAYRGIVSQGTSLSMTIAGANALTGKSILMTATYIV